jgi:hypothetical protein
MARIVREFTPAEREEWERLVAEVEAEYPLMAKRFDIAEIASAEDSFSGDLRRAVYAIHGRGISLPRLLREVNVDWPTLNAFLHGEGLLSNDVIDRLTRFLGLHLQEAAATQTAGHAERE